MLCTPPPQNPKYNFTAIIIYNFVILYVAKPYEIRTADLFVFQIKKKKKKPMWDVQRGIKYVKGFYKFGGEAHL
jgi:hypothetical protein